MRFTAHRKLNPLFSDLSGDLEKDEGCAQVSDSELLPKEKKREGFCALALAFFPLRIYRTTVDSVSCTNIAKL